MPTDSTLSGAERALLNRLAVLAVSLAAKVDAPPFPGRDATITDVDAWIRDVSRRLGAALSTFRLNTPAAAGPQHHQSPRSTTMRIRAKVTVNSKTVRAWPGTSVTMNPVYDTGIPEDQRFAEATPSGELNLLMKNDVAAQFELGKQYYVDFTEATAPVGHGG